MKSWKVDIGVDGGTLEYRPGDSPGAQPVYLINDHEATPEQVDTWIHRWHQIRDGANGDPRCNCPPCTRHLVQDQEKR